MKDAQHNIVNWVEEDNYVFDMKKYLQDPLFTKFLETNVGPEAGKNLAFQHYDKICSTTDMLLSVSRPKERLDWAITIPDDDQQGIYVWLDALSNYLTTAKPGTYQSQLHLVGKDIIKFHAIYWPAILMALDIDIFKHRVFAHGHWTINHQKMSKSLGNVLDPINSELVNNLPLEDSCFRWFLLKGGNQMENSVFRTDLLIETIKKDIIGGIGGMPNRMTSVKSNPLQKWPSREECDFSLFPEIDDYFHQQKQNFKQFENYLNSEENYMRWDGAIKVLVDMLLLQHKTMAALKLYKIDPTNPKEVVRRNTWHAVFYESMRNFAILAKPVVPEISKWLFDRYSIGDVVEVQTFESMSYHLDCNDDVVAKNSRFYPKVLENIELEKKQNLYPKVNFDTLLNAKLM